MRTSVSTCVCLRVSTNCCPNGPFFLLIPPCTHTTKKSKTRSSASANTLHKKLQRQMSQQQPCLPPSLFGPLFLLSIAAKCQVRELQWMTHLPTMRFVLSRASSSLRVIENCVAFGPSPACSATVTSCPRFATVFSLMGLHYQYRQNHSMCY